MRSLDLFQDIQKAVTDLNNLGQKLRRNELTVAEVQQRAEEIVSPLCPPDGSADGSAKPMSAKQITENFLANNETS